MSVSTNDTNVKDNGKIPNGIFSYVWTHSRFEQLELLATTFLSFPILYLLLEIPKTIINDALSSEVFPRTLLGVEFGQYGYLIALCFAFLSLVILAGMIKMRINVRKGTVSEKLVRRLRYQLVEKTLKGNPDVSQGELIPIITAETGKLNDFFGDAISTPAFMGGTMLTILGFLMVQNVWLGLASIAVIPLQIYWIPKLQKKVNLLHRKTVAETRKLSNQISDSMNGLDNLKSAGALPYTLSNFSDWLNTLYANRLQVHIKKNFVKFLNNFLNQITPFLFFLLGGILVIRNELTLGALVAGLSAYKDLTSPWKELLAFYQATAESAQRYFQIIAPFNADDSASSQPKSGAPQVSMDKQSKFDLSVSGLSASNKKSGVDIIDVNLEVPASAFVAVSGGNPDELDLLANTIIGTQPATGGHVLLSGHDISKAHVPGLSRHLGYLDGNSHVFGASIDDNIALGLKNTPPDTDTTVSPDFSSWVESARSTGNFEIPPGYDWLGEAGKSALDSQTKLDMYQLLGIDRAMFFRGLNAGFYEGAHDTLEQQINETRNIVREHIDKTGIGELVYPFDINEFNPYASLDENIIFGSPLDAETNIEDIISHPFTVKLLDDLKLASKLVEVGRTFGEHIIQLIEQNGADSQALVPYDFVNGELLENLKAVSVRLAMSANKLEKADKLFLIRLAFRINPQRHDVDIFDDSMKAQIVTARKEFHAQCPDDLRQRVEFFDGTKFNHGLSVQCNLLFGRIAFSHREAYQQITDLLEVVCRENGLDRPLVLLASERQAGFGGSDLSNDIKEILPVMRELIKSPEILILNRALRGLGTDRRQDIIEKIRGHYPKMSILHIDDTVPNIKTDKTYTLEDSKLTPTPDRTGS
jgi:putative ABC transport system ATP-binding protein